MKAYELANLLENADDINNLTIEKENQYLIISALRLYSMLEEMSDKINAVFRENNKNLN